MRKKIYVLKKTILYLSLDTLDFTKCPTDKPKDSLTRICIDKVNEQNKNDLITTCALSINPTIKNESKETT